jgi:rhodanese-related sulfurtransferase
MDERLAKANFFRYCSAMRNIFSILTLVSIASVAACAGEQKPAEAPATTNATVAHDAMPMITAGDLEARMKAQPTETFVFDANNTETFQAGHIPTAKWLSYDAVTADKLPAKKDAFIVFYCKNEQCGASHQAAETAMKLGYTNVKVFKGGIDGWKSASKTVEK